MSSHYFFFFFNDTATTEIYTLSLHDALPISDQFVRMTYTRTDNPSAYFKAVQPTALTALRFIGRGPLDRHRGRVDRKSTRLNSSHSQISYAVFCLKKKKP